MTLFRKTVIGIQIEPQAVRVVEVELGRRPQVLSCGERSLPEGALKADQRVADIQVVTTCLREALSSAIPRSINSRTAYLSISESQVFRKIIEVPAALDEPGLKDLITTEVAEYLPAPAEEMQVDYQFLPDEYGEGKGADKRRLLSVMAVDRALINGYLEVCNQARVHVLAIDSRTAALARATVKPNDHALVLIVKWGSDHITISLVESAIVLSTGLVRAVSNDDPQATAQLVADEIEHVLKFYANRTGSSKHPERVLVVGSVPDLDKLVKPLAKQAGIETFIAEAIVPFPEQRSSVFYPALGSAFYSLYDLV